MTPQQQKQTKRRVARLRDRLSRNEERHAACQSLDACSRGWLKTITAEVIAASKLKDQDDDGDIQFDDLVDAIVDWLDKAVELGNPIIEGVSDIGFEVAGWIAIAIHKGTEKRLDHRIARDTAMIQNLEARLQAA
jgi:hypothetical protein